jgi:hypothetical protein
LSTKRGKVHLVSIGYFWARNFVVADRGLGKIHVFSNDGLYLCTTGRFTNEWAQMPSKFTSQLGIDFFQRAVSFGASNHADETVTQLFSYSLRDWTTSTGVRLFLPGADAVPTATQSPTHYFLKWKLTNYCNAYVEILNGSDQVLLQIESGSSFYADEYTYTVAKSAVPGAVWLRVKVLPYSNSIYAPEYRQNWGERRFNLLTATGVPTSEDLPQEFLLHQNFPNPFNPSTKVRFDVPISGTVSLKVYDVLGREVATLMNERVTPGSYEVNFNATGFASGVYFYRIDATLMNGGNGFVQVKKMLLLR